jgi:hypothetical protein
MALSFYQFSNVPARFCCVSLGGVPRRLLGGGDTFLLTPRCESSGQSGRVVTAVEPGAPGAAAYPRKFSLGSLPGRFVRGVLFAPSRKTEFHRALCRNEALRLGATRCIPRDRSGKLRRHPFSPRRGSVEVSSTAFQRANSRVCESTCDFRVAARSRALSAPSAPRRGDLSFAPSGASSNGLGKPVVATQPLRPANPAHKQTKTRTSRAAQTAHEVI